MNNIPKSITPVADHISSLVKAFFPCSSCLDDFDDLTVNMWLRMCDYHESFHQDAERYIDDVFSDLQVNHRKK